MSESFLYREIPRLGKRVHRLALASTYGIDEAGVREAMAQGINFFMYYATRSAPLLQPLREALQRNRDGYVLATGPTTAWFGGSLRKWADKTRKELNTDYLDILQLNWLGITSAWTEGTVNELIRLRESGVVKMLGVSIHDRPRAGKLAEDSPLDSLMIRYNASHPGAEQDIFPHLAKRKPLVMAYTATNWRRLLNAPKGWTGQAMTAGDCYRFCLSSPHVDVVLGAPGSQAQLLENLAALQRGPLQESENHWMRDFGKAVKGWM